MGSRRLTLSICTMGTGQHPPWGHSEVLDQWPAPLGSTRQNGGGGHLRWASVRTQCQFTQNPRTAPPLKGALASSRGQGDLPGLALSPHSGARPSDVAPRAGHPDLTVPSPPLLCSQTVSADPQA